MASSTSSKRSRLDDEGEPQGPAQKKTRTPPRTAASQALENHTLDTRENNIKTKSWRDVVATPTPNTATGVAQPHPNRPYGPRTTPPKRYNDLRPLNPRDINEGIIVVIRTFDKYWKKNLPSDSKYEREYVHKVDDKFNTELNIKSRKYVIISVAPGNHFVALPIYSKHMPDKPADYRAEIIDSRDYDRMHSSRGWMTKAFYIGPRCRGRHTEEKNIIAGRVGGKGTWLVVKHQSKYPGWMIGTGTVELNQPVHFSIHVDAEWVGTLKNRGQIEMVKQWHLEAMAHDMGMTVPRYTGRPKVHQPWVELHGDLRERRVPYAPSKGTQTDEQDSSAVDQLKKTLEQREKRIEKLENDIREQDEKIGDLQTALVLGKPSKGKKNK